MCESPLVSNGRQAVTQKREMMAILWAVTCVRPCVWGGRLTHITDRSALISVFQSQNLSSNLRR